MSAITEHSHAFLPSSWPFDSSESTATFTTMRLWQQELPILRVFRCANGDWQFFNGDVADDDEGLMVCFGCVFERDASIGILGTLPRGWSATRAIVGGSWESEPFDEN